MTQIGAQPDQTFVYFSQSKRRVLGHARFHQPVLNLKKLTLHLARQHAALTVANRRDHREDSGF